MKTIDGYNTYADLLSKDGRVLICPIGSAFQHIYRDDRRRLGEAPENRKDSLFSRLYCPDAYHPSRLGTYLAALCFFGVLTGRCPVGSRYTPNHPCAFDDDMRRRFGESWTPKHANRETIKRLQHAAASALWPRLSGIVNVPKCLAARVLYSNPVCLLCTSSPETPERKRNVMTISWVTCVDNSGSFVCALNSSRSSAVRLQREHARVLAQTESDIEKGALFTLSVPTAGMERMILEIGSCSGRDVDKSQIVCGWRYVLPGWDALEPSDTAESSKSGPQKRLRTIGKKAAKRRRLELEDQAIRTQRCIDACVAHIVCRVSSIQRMENGHLLIRATVVRAYVRSAYWRDEATTTAKRGRDAGSWEHSATFGPRSSGKYSVPPPGVLTFLGSRTFGTITRIHRVRDLS